MAARRTRYRRNPWFVGVKMKKWTIITLVLFVAGLATYQFVIPSAKQDTQSVLLKTTTSQCDPVKSSCEAGDNQHSVTLHFPGNVAYLKPFKMQVTLRGFRQEEIKKIIVDFKMVGMDMGMNRYTLLPVEDGDGNVVYQGEGILPVCVSGRVDWVANTEVMTADKLYEAVFEFKVTKQ